MNTLANWHGGGPGPWILFLPLLWAFAVGGAVLLLRRFGRRPGPGGPAALGPWGGPGAARTARADNAPLDVLGRRFAAGEIDEDEYWRRFAVLQEGGYPGKDGDTA